MNSIRTHSQLLAGMVAATLLTACSQGGGPSYPTPTGTAPSIMQLAVDVGANAEGSIPITFTLADPDSDVADVEIEVSVDDGRSFRPGRFSQGQDSRGLRTSPDGVEYTLQWNALDDLGFRDPKPATFRLRARGVVPGNPFGHPGEPFELALPVIDNLQTAIAGIDNYLIHYGRFDAETIALSKAHDLVILHPFAGLVRPEIITEIQLGLDPTDPADDVIVLGYLSIGEDLRTALVTDEEMLLDPRFVGDGTGPRVDPRGPDADGDSLVGIDRRGSPSLAGTGYASFYLDDNSVDADPTQRGDGKPDRNTFFGGCFVNPGDPAWLEALDEMTFSRDGIPGSRELLTKDFGRGYGCDGLFLDTLDTCAPNNFTDPTSPNPGEFEWTAPGCAQFLQDFKQRYPRSLLLQNRGLFYFDPRYPHYRVNTRPAIDFLLVESFRLNSSATQSFDPYFFADNKFNVGPKIIVEANRPDGFRVLSLGYAEGPGISHETLFGRSEDGLADLVEDIREAQDVHGFLHFLTDELIKLPNTFVRDRGTSTNEDVTPPTWTSTWNDQEIGFPIPPGEPTPRVGIQTIEQGPNCATIQFDVALDRSRVSYALYQSSQPFDFAGDPTLAQAKRTVVVPKITEGYLGGIGPDRYPNKVTITDLVPEEDVWFCLRAFDSQGNEERNEVEMLAIPGPPPVITIDGDFTDWIRVPSAVRDPADVPDSDGPDWLELKVFDDGVNLYLSITSENLFFINGPPTSYARCLIMMDLDEDATTGFPTGTIGSELVLFGDEMFEQDQGTFSGLSRGRTVALPLGEATRVEIAVPLSVLRSLQPDLTTVRIHFVNDDANDFAPDFGSVDYRLR